MPAYVIATVLDAWDQPKLLEYRERNTIAVANRCVSCGAAHLRPTSGSSKASSWSARQS